MPRGTSFVDRGLVRAVIAALGDAPVRLKLWDGSGLFPGTYAPFARGTNNDVPWTRAHLYGNHAAGGAP